MITKKKLNNFLNDTYIDNTVDELYYDNVDFAFERFQLFFEYRYKVKRNKMIIFFNRVFEKKNEILVANDCMVIFVLIIKLSLSLLIHNKVINENELSFQNIFTKSYTANKMFNGDKYIILNRFWKNIFYDSDIEWVNTFLSNLTNEKSTKKKNINDIGPLQLELFKKTCLFWMNTYEVSKKRFNINFNDVIHDIFDSIEIVVEDSIFGINKSRNFSIDEEAVQRISNIFHMKDDYQSKEVVFPKENLFYQFLVNYHFKKIINQVFVDDAMKVMMDEIILQKVERDQYRWNFFSFTFRILGIYEVLTNKNTDYRIIMNVKKEELNFTYLFSSFYTLNSYIDRSDISTEYKDMKVNKISIDSFSFTFIITFILEWVNGVLDTLLFVKYVKQFEFFFIKSILNHRSIWSAQFHLGHVVNKLYEKNNTFNLKDVFDEFINDLYKVDDNSNFCCEQTSVIVRNKTNNLSNLDTESFYLDQFDNRKRLFRLIEISVYKFQYYPDKLMKTLRTLIVNMEHSNNENELLKLKIKLLEDKINYHDWLKKSVFINSIGALFLIDTVLNGELGSDPISTKASKIKNYLIYQGDRQFRMYAKIMLNSISRKWNLDSVVKRSIEKLDDFIDKYLIDSGIGFERICEIELNYCKLFVIPRNELIELSNYWN